MPPSRLQIRAAVQLREVYLSRAVHTIDEALTARLVQYHRELESVRASLRRAASRGLLGNVLPVRRHLFLLTKSVEDAVAQTELDLDQPTAPVPDLRFLLDELQQLEDEFGEVKLEIQIKKLSVVTEQIVLENVHLGCFRIQLSWKTLADEAGHHNFEIVALDPNPAASNDAVTHPHVSDGSLCPGDAWVPIQRALEQGRIADAFCLVRSVLTNYNSNSPYVPLGQWNGVSCHECGYRVDPDDLSTCEGCCDGYCSDCILECGSCEYYRCLACMERCSHCDLRCCRDCLQACSACTERSCPGCRKRCAICAAQLCTTCQTQSAHSDKVCCEGCLRDCAGCGAKVASDEIEPSNQFCPTCRTNDAEPAATPVAAEPIPDPSPNTMESDHATETPLAAVRGAAARIDFRTLGLVEAAVLLSPRRH